MNARALDERLFYRNPWLSEADAIVMATEWEDGVKPGHVRVLLDTTIFYPEGGGQPPDLGFIERARVVDVQEIDGQIWHFVEIPPEAGNGGAWLAQKGVRAGASVHLRIDWQRRLYHMQQHTGQHLLSAVLEQDYGIHTLSFHLGTDYCTIDVSAKNPADLPLEEIEAKVEGWIERDVLVRIHYCPPEDVAAFRLRKRPPADEAVIRVVEIDGYDWSPCGGTHVERTGQLRALKLLSLERYKGNVRVYFAAGAHALELLFKAYEEAKQAALLLGAGVGDLSTRLRDSMEKTAHLEKKTKKCAQQRAEAEARLAISQTEPEAVLEFKLEDEDAERGTGLVKAAAVLRRAAIAVSLPDSTVVVQVVQHGNFPALAELLKEKMTALGGKGGGGATFFRANFASPDQAVLFAGYAKEALGTGRS
jgi:Ser-tRNA(Ala) deacylase AlaX